ncbi:MAG: hypothetical protein JWM16_5131 [Verrucomicrobiales bacterium]|jgi:hypothetical protein|nr:hypothetical protein [Verrucomicrobiales bacterium]
MITVETTDTGTRVTIPKNEMPPERLNSILDWLRLETIASRSDLSEENAERLAEEIKSGWWNSNKGRFIKSSDQ